MAPATPCHQSKPFLRHLTPAKLLNEEKITITPSSELVYGAMAHATDQKAVAQQFEMALPVMEKKKNTSTDPPVIISAVWMTKSNLELQPLPDGGEESKESLFYPRTIAPTADQVHYLQFLIYEVVSGGNLGWPGGFLKNRASKFPMHGLKPLESALMPCDSAQQAWVILKPQFLYDEDEAEVDHCFDIFVSEPWATIFPYYKSWAASELLDPSFLFASDKAEQYTVQLLKITTEKLLQSILQKFPLFHLEDKVSLKGGVMMEPAIVVICATERGSGNYLAVTNL